jgi:hypothetical protein
MAYNDFFGGIDNTMRNASVGVIRRNVIAAAGPTVLYAVGAMQVSITIYDVQIISTAAPAMANTMTIQTAIGGAGAANMSSAIVLAAVGDLGRTATIVAAQAAVGPADTIQCVHAAADVAGIVHLLFFLT